MGDKLTAGKTVIVARYIGVVGIIHFLVQVLAGWWIRRLFPLFL